MRIRNLVYPVIAVSCFVAGDRFEHYLHTLPAENRVSELEGKLSGAIDELAKYRATLPDGRQAKLNPDMSVTVTGIEGDMLVDVQPQEFRSWRK